MRFKKLSVFGNREEKKKTKKTLKIKPLETEELENRRSSPTTLSLKNHLFTSASDYLFIGLRHGTLMTYIFPVLGKLLIYYEL